jgi:hypothetical protein
MYEQIELSKYYVVEFPGASQNFQIQGHPRCCDFVILKDRRPTQRGTQQDATVARVAAGSSSSDHPKFPYPNEKQHQCRRLDAKFCGYLMFGRMIDRNTTEVTQNHPLLSDGTPLALPGLETKCRTLICLMSSALHLARGRNAGF